MRAAFFLFFFLTSIGTMLIGQEQNILTIDSIKKNSPSLKISKPFSLLVHQVESGNYERFFSYSRDRIFKSKLYGNLILSSSNSIMFAKEIEAGKLFFTIFYFDGLQKIIEIKYFFYSPIGTLKLEFLLGREELIKQIGIPIGAQSLIEQLTTSWIYEGYNIEILFKRENISKEGSIILSIKKAIKINIEEEVAYLDDKKKDILIGQVQALKKGTSLRLEGKDGAKILKRLQKGEELAYLGESNSYWFKVKYKHIEGWIKKALINWQKETPEKSTSKQASELVAPKVIENIEQANSSISKIENKDIPITKPKELKKVSDSIISQQNPSISNIEPTPSSETKVNEILLLLQKQTSLRQEGRDGAKVIKRLKAGTRLESLGESNFYWTKVKYQNIEGWVKKSLLSSDEE